MIFSSFRILAFFLAFVILYNGVKYLTKNRLLRNIVIVLANICIISLIAHDHTIIVLAIACVLFYYLGNFIRTRKSKALLSFGLVFVITLFCLRNYPYLQEAISTGFFSFLHAPIMSVEKLGLSYILFRLIHWLVESYRGKIHSPDLLTFINYILFFPSILAGPIDTYNNFEYWITNQRRSYQKVLFFAGITRVFLGAFKTMVIVPLIITYATSYALYLADFSPSVAILLNAITYSAYIYIDFSGYSDLAIGTAYMIGIKTPENFDSPYLAKNLSSFWKKWHITFSNFLGLYVFKPIIALFNRVFNHKYRLLVSILGYLTTFTICGLWHGDTMNFILWGLWHGVGLSINKIWTSKLKGRFIKNETWVYNAASTVLTFLFVSIGWLFFNYSLEGLTTINDLLWS